MKGVRKGVAKVLGHRLGITRAKDLPKQKHPLAYWRWKVAVSVLLVLAVHMLSANLLLPILSQHHLPGERAHVRIHLEETYEAAVLELEDLAPSGLQTIAAGGSSRSSSSSSSERVLVQQRQQQQAGQGSLVQSASEPGRQRSETEVAAAVGSALAAGKPSSSWVPARRELREQQGGALPRPSSIAAWLCGDGSPEAQSEESLPFRYEYVMKSKAYVKSRGKSTPSARWCRGGVPWEVPQLRKVLLLESSKGGSPSSDAKGASGTGKLGPSEGSGWGGGKAGSSRQLLGKRQGSAGGGLEEGITLATHLTLDLLPALETQCRLWPRRLSAVLYVPLVLGRVFSEQEPGWNGSTLDVAIVQALRFHAAMEVQQGACTLDLELAVEERCSSGAALLYPGNALRNRALKNVKTQAVMLLDVDLAVSHSLAAFWEEPAQRQALMRTLLQQRTALVLPALESAKGGEAGRRLALEAAARGKAFVAQQYSWGKMAAFHTAQPLGDQRATDLKRWLRSEAAYNVTYQQGFEPFLLAATQNTPWYDERYRGQHWSKTQQLMHTARQLKVQLAVHPSAFLVHLPHSKPSLQALSVHYKQKEFNYELLKSELLELEKGRFVPVTSFPQDCTGNSLFGSDH